MSENNQHFIKNIEIKNFKCFKDFKAEGFSRVNLITGKNNVGKTAFLEACFLIANIQELYKIYQKYKLIKRSAFAELEFNTMKLLLILEKLRNKSNFDIQWITEELKLIYDDLEIESSGEKIRIQDQYLSLCSYSANSIPIYEEEMYPELPTFDKDDILVCGCENYHHNFTTHKISKFREYSQYQKLYTKNKLPKLNNYSFISICSDVNELKYLIGNLKLENKLDNFNSYLKSIFSIDGIDDIQDNIMLKKDTKYFKLSTFGDGIKHFIFIVASLMSAKSLTIYLDEVENGIHYSKLDELWEIILKTSKELNVQVFATTHSKECIESYARVAKKLEEKEVTLMQLVKVKSGEIKAGVYNYEVLESAVLEQKHEVRG